MAALKEQRSSGMQFFLIIELVVLTFCSYPSFANAFVTKSLCPRANIARKIDAYAQIRFPLFANLVEESIRDDDTSHSYVLKQRNPYDVHVYYGNTEEQEAAMELRQKMMKAFPWMRFYGPKGFPIGPHPVPMWEADFGNYENRNQWTTVRDFILDNNPENLSILIHPHSVDGDYADHTKHAFWTGEKLELRIRGWR
mmetsp:Transcript_681/g.1638  ORF Transcript_681/g.1638 Transcript_681/m.1638 type:complete len:197 (-) Transcript_681:158-748(-)|eukprot:CAMPEP_0116121036 /NCGR_PEP_ID=MMETSP0329-20121206/3489_1 /TAXON_ID=697910 /ORGANISM="Pseudo-nitzschia arenysensis, Strain B593" /LENGTH=196 /DNA_ID=CAMNT_0003614835 /DNA_START=128 /DNA_END=718 /DNA_ORIENTATION=+